MIACEIQLYKDGKWKVDSVFDDAKLAKIEAEKINESNRHPKIRVIEEIYDEDGGLTTTRTIFRGGNSTVEAKKKKIAPRARPIQSKPSSEERREPTPRLIAGAVTKSSSMVVSMLVMSVLVLAGIAATFGLQQLPQLQ